LTQGNEVISKQWITEARSGRCSLDFRFSERRLLDSAEKHRGAHRIFVADALEPRGQGFILLRSWT
jgi:hypothetical protein